MAVVGPIVRNEIFFFIFIFGAALVLVLREWLTASHAKIAAIANPAERRLLESQRRRQGRWAIAAASACLAVILALTADFLYADRKSTRLNSSHMSISYAVFCLKKKKIR